MSKRSKGTREYEARREAKWVRVDAIEKMGEKLIGRCISGCSARILTKLEGSK